MDGVAASIDHATEKNLQEIIAHDFLDATVLTIARRLATVLDSDCIVTSSDGEVIELDMPTNLV